MIFVKVASSIFHNASALAASNERLSTRLLGKEKGEINSSEPDASAFSHCLTRKEPDKAPIKRHDWVIGREVKTSQLED